MEFKRLLEFCDSLSTSRPNDDIRSRLPNALKQNPRAFEPYEKALQKLDSENWERIKQKLQDRLVRDPLRGWAQFFEALSEVRGFSYLVDQGCNNLRFIPENNDIRTPDIEGEQPNGAGVLLESKVIGFSEDERRYILENSERLALGQELVVREVETELSTELQNKVRGTIESAKEQLISYIQNDNTVRRIIYLTIQLDFHYMLNPKKYAEVVNFLKRLIRTEADVEIVIDHEISTI